jgi:aminoglycoside 6'-N-acetyltransferase I
MSSDLAGFTFQKLTTAARGLLRSEWVRLRHALWHDGVDALEAQLDQLHHAGVPYVSFLACSGEDNGAVAFAEASLRPYVNGCESSPVAFLEGIFVEPTHRRRGLARELISRVEQWGRAEGCSEFASDILVDNEASHAAHVAWGFVETERVIYFKKSLGP